MCIDINSIENHSNLYCIFFMYWWMGYNKQGSIVGTVGKYSQICKCLDPEENPVENYQYV